MRSEKAPNFRKRLGFERLRRCDNALGVGGAGNQEAAKHEQEHEEE